MASDKDPTCRCRRHKKLGFDPWVGKILWGRAWQLTSVFLRGESHGQRSLAGYSPRGHKESTQLKQLSTHTHAVVVQEMWAHPDPSYVAFWALGFMGGDSSARCQHWTAS